MKLNRMEWCSIAVALLFLVGLAGYRMGLQQGTTPMSLVTERGVVLTQTAPEDIGAAVPDSPADAAVPDMEPEPNRDPQKLLDLNTADAELLQVLPGIGEVLAERIVAYREEHGGFASVEDVMNVKGIGEGKFAAIRDLICVAPPEQADAQP